MFALEEVGLPPVVKLEISILGGVVIVNIATHNLKCIQVFVCLNYLCLFIMLKTIYIEKILSFKKKLRQASGEVIQLSNVSIH